ncbi:intradiol ring-cleavage dioxygenase [Ekhidna sp.]|uniref:dioxygenase family protein n=1 Tax=Ekhidna sp. TaxID=2608089 RepID=UPI0032EF95B0
MRYIFILLSISCLQACGQKTNYRLIDSGRCDGCEAVLEFGDRKLNAVDTLPLFEQTNPKIKVFGTVYQPDGTTPAEGVILYLYHTNRDGIYPKRGDEKGWARRHGYIRGWVKTDQNGQYAFYTFRPASYPSGTEAEHIHITVLEPDGKYYWIGSYLFHDDPLLTDRDIDKTPRGGSDGVLKLTKEGNLLTDRRDIVLGKNVPNYD